MNLIGFGTKGDNWEEENVSKIDSFSVWNPKIIVNLIWKEADPEDMRLDKINRLIFGISLAIIILVRSIEVISIVACVFEKAKEIYL